MIKKLQLTCLSSSIVAFSSTKPVGHPAGIKGLATVALRISANGLVGPAFKKFSKYVL